MFTVEEFSTAYAATFGGLTGWPVGSGSVAVGVILIIPIIERSTTFKGCISQGSKSDWGDRPCFHFDAQGTVLLPKYADSIVSTVVDPCYTYAQGYRGDRYVVDQKTITFSDLTTRKVGGPVWTPGSNSFTFVYPDHQNSGVAWYRNISVINEMTPTTFKSVTSYDVKYSLTGTWSTVKNVTELDLDIPNKRWRTKGSSSWTVFKALRTGGSINTSISHSTLKMREWSDAYYRLRGWFIPLIDQRIIGDLCRRCANDARGIDTNGISLVHELATLSSQMKDAYSLLKGKKTLKNLSSIFLSYKYGARLTAADVYKIFGERAHIIQALSGRKSWVRASNGITSRPIVSNPMTRYTFYTYKIVYHSADDLCRQFVSNWIDTGLFPTLENGWDLIPYSFVVDWFADVQGSVQQYDAATYWSVHSIIGTTSSSKDSFSGVRPGDLFPWLSHCIGQLDVKRYRRVTSKTLDLPSYFDDTPQDFKNFAELTALILQKSKK